MLSAPQHKALAALLHATAKRLLLQVDNDSAAVEDGVAPSTLRHLFNMVDSNRDGFISIADLRLWVMASGG